MLEKYKAAYMEIKKDQIVKNCNTRKVKFKACQINRILKVNTWGMQHIKPQLIPVSVEQSDKEYCWPHWIGIKSIAG